MIGNPLEHVWAALTYRVGDVEKRVTRLEGIVSLETSAENPRSKTISRDLGSLCAKYKVSYEDLTGHNKSRNLETIRHSIIGDLANMGWPQAAVADAMKRHARNIQKRWPFKLRKK